jgi:hypothetical protein
MTSRPVIDRLDRDGETFWRIAKMILAVSELILGEANIINMPSLYPL